MTRLSNDQYIGGRLINGYDYTNQAWVIDGKYVPCGHVRIQVRKPDGTRELKDWCNCYGRLHRGEETKALGVAYFKGMVNA